MNTLYKQKLAKTLGEEGCYFLSLVWLAEQETGRNVDAMALFGEAVAKGWMGDDCYMKKPAEMMGALLGRKCAIRKSWNFSEVLAENQRDIWCYKREAVGVTYYHFVAMDKGGNVAYDPLEDSNTVRLGKPYSRRILTIGEG